MNVGAPATGQLVTRELSEWFDLAQCDAGHITQVMTFKAAGLGITDIRGPVDVTVGAYISSDVSFSFPALVSMATRSLAPLCDPEHDISQVLAIRREPSETTKLQGIMLMVRWQEEEVADASA